jgi:hypothetical protein
MNFSKYGIITNDVELSYYNDRYLNHHKSILLQKESLLPIKGYTVDIKDKSKNIVSTLGEFFEREILINKNQNFSENLIGFSLINGNTKTISKDTIIYNNKFVDSCGMASHIKSFDIIKKSLFEFFERQCLVLSYLSQHPGQEIDESMFNDDINEYRNYLFNFVDELKFFNISLSERVYVILGIGLGETYKCIGLGTSENITEAIISSQQEMLQYFFSSYRKSKKEINYSTKKNSKDLYHVYFESLTCNEFNACYKYLEGGSFSTHFHKHNEFNIKNFLNEIYLNYRMEPFAFFFPNQRSIDHLKIIKIMDQNWFPNIYPNSFLEKTYINAESITGRKLDRSIKYIPFP